MSAGSRFFSARLLPDDVVVAERERELARHVRAEARDQRGDAAPSTTATASMVSRLRLTLAREGRRATLRLAAWELMGTGRRVSQVRGTVSSLNSSRLPSLRIA